MSAGKALERRPTAGTVLTTQDPIKLAEHFAKSGYFKDARDLSQAVVKIAAGEELGLGPMGSMQGIHIIEGKPSLSANVLASLVKRHPNYDYIPRQVSDEGAKIEFFQNGEPIGTSEFSMADAQRAGIAGKQNFKRYPKAMMFARALSQGVRWYCPDVTAGSPAYVPEELGAEVSEEGVPVEAEVRTTVDAAAEAGEELPGADVPVDALVLLDEERVEGIIAGFRALHMRYRDINLLLGACGIDGLRANSAKAIQERLEGLTPEQADLLERKLAAKADGGDDGE